MGAVAPAHQNAVLRIAQVGKGKEYGVKTALFDVTQGKKSVQWGGLATVGVEWEFALVDAVTRDLSNEAAAVITRTVSAIPLAFASGHIPLRPLLVLMMLEPA